MVLIDAIFLPQRLSKMKHVAQTIRVTPLLLCISAKETLDFCALVFEPYAVRFVADFRKTKLRPLT